MAARDKASSGSVAGQMGSTAGQAGWEREREDSGWLGLACVWVVIVSSGSLSFRFEESNETGRGRERCYPEKLASWKCTGQFGCGSWVEIPQRNWLGDQSRDLGLDYGEAMRRGRER